MIVYDVGWIAEPDAPTLDALARLQLTARRLGVTIELRNACPVLVDLIAYAGLSDVLFAVGRDQARSSVEMYGQIEERKQGGIDEDVLGGDAAVRDGEDLD